MIDYLSHYTPSITASYCGGDSLHKRFTNVPSTLSAYL
jgi:hypothetical protein